MEEKKSYLVDGVSTIGVHNGVVRIEFFQLQPDGRPKVVLELQIPQNQVKNVAQAILKVGI